MIIFLINNFKIRKKSNKIESIYYKINDNNFIESLMNIIIFVLYSFFVYLKIIVFK